MRSSDWSSDVCSSDLHAVGSPAAIHSGIGAGAGGAHRRGHHHYRDRAHAGVWRYERRISSADSDRVRPVHCLCGLVVLSVVLLLLGRRADMTAMANLPEGFEAPLHRALTETILLGGAPRTVAIANGPLAAAFGLGLQLWLPRLACWFDIGRAHGGTPVN